MSIAVYKYNINAIKTVIWSLCHKLVNQARMQIPMFGGGDMSDEGRGERNCVGLM